MSCGRVCMHVLWSVHMHHWSSHMEDTHAWYVGGTHTCGVCMEVHMYHASSSMLSPLHVLRKGLSHCINWLAKQEIPLSPPRSPGITGPGFYVGAGAEFMFSYVQSEEFTDLVLTLSLQP